MPLRSPRCVFGTRHPCISLQMRPGWPALRPRGTLGVVRTWVVPTENSRSPGERALS